MAKAMYQLTPISPGFTYVTRDPNGEPTEKFISNISELDTALEALEYDADNLTVNDKVYAFRVLTNYTGEVPEEE